MHQPSCIPVKMTAAASHRPSPGRVVLASAAIALSGCQGIANPADQPEIRIIDLSPDLPGTDIYQGETPIAYNLTYGNVTSYIRVHSGASDLSAQATGSRQTLASVRGAFSPAGRYTVLIGNTFAAPDPVILKDQNTPAPPGQISLRFLHQALTHGAVDVYLLPSGISIPSSTPLIPAQPFTANSGYLNVPAGTYRVAVYPAGAFPGTSPLLRGPRTTYAPGSAATILLLDPQRPSSPSMRMIDSLDFDPGNNPR